MNQVFTEALVPLEPKYRAPTSKISRPTPCPRAPLVTLGASHVLPHPPSSTGARGHSKNSKPKNAPVSHPSHLGLMQARDHTRGDGIEKGKTPEPLGKTRRHKIAHVIGTTLQKLQAGH